MFNWFKKQFSSDATTSENTTTPEQVHRGTTASHGVDHGHDNSQYMQQGDALLKAGKPDEAIRCYEQALDVNPHDAQAHNALGDIYYEKQMLAEAEASYHRAIQIKPDYSDALLNLGLVLDQQTRLDEAEICYRKVVLIKPDNALAHFNLSITLKAQARWQEAESSCRKALEIKPDFSHAHFNLATLLQQQDQLAEAEASYRTAISINPDFLQAHFSLAMLLQQDNKLSQAADRLEHILRLRPDATEARDSLLNILMVLQRFPEAEILCRYSLELAPDNVITLYNLSVTLREQTKLIEAETGFRKVVELKPDFTEAHFNLGSILHQQGKLADAESSYRNALAIQAYTPALTHLADVIQAQGRMTEAEIILQQVLTDQPDDAASHFKLALLHIEQGKLPEAENGLKNTLLIQKDFADAHGAMALLLMNQGRYPAAEASLQRVLQIRPGDAVAHDNLGLISYQQGKFSESISSFKSAIALDSTLLNAHNNLASAYKRLGRLQDAEASYQTVLQMDADSPMAHNNLALVYVDQGRIDEAVILYRKALDINPDFAESHTNLLFALNYHPDLSSAEIYAAYQEYDVRFANIYEKDWLAFAARREPGRRLKIGYVSPDLYNHSVKYFLEPLLAHHDKSKVEVYAYAQLNWEDEATARYKTYADHWIPTMLMSDEALAARIRADGIDILVDLAGHTGQNRLLVFARKPAPVSVSWLGFGYTTGIKAIDYMLMDDTSMPAGSEQIFAEQPWRLDTPGYAYRPGEGMGAVNSLPALQRNYITFGTLSRAIRINDKLIAVWSAILKKVPGSRLIIDSSNFRENFMQEAFIEKFAAHGIAPSRLDVGCHSPPWDTMRKIDIGLDCFPHNSGTTLFETLYMGVPYVTLAGRPSMGLLGSSILKGAGHPEWIANTEQEYIDKAVALASNLPALASLRDGLREKMKASALMDETGFASKVETAYRGMWTKWCEQSPA